jgi:DHA1 family tetracycline resistance protein-like MFS transporter
LLFANLFALFISKHAPVQDFSGVAFVLAAALVVGALVLTAYATRGLPTPAAAAQPGTR